MPKRSDLALLFTLILAIALACRQLSSLSSFINPLHREPLQQQNPPPSSPRIKGRWKTVRASLGLPPLSDRVRTHVSPPAVVASTESTRPRISSRFDLRRRRLIEEHETRKNTAVIVPLFFAPDASQRRNLSLDDFLGSFPVPSLDSRLAETENVTANANSKGDASWNARTEPVENKQPEGEMTT